MSNPQTTEDWDKIIYSNDGVKLYNKRELRALKQPIDKDLANLKEMIRADRICYGKTPEAYWEEMLDLIIKIDEKLIPSPEEVNGILIHKPQKISMKKASLA